jgi:hypothetical protein
VRVFRRSVGAARLPSLCRTLACARQHPHLMQPSYSVSHPVGAAHRALCGSVRRAAARLRALFLAKDPLKFGIIDGVLLLRIILGSPAHLKVASARNW